MTSTAITYKKPNKGSTTQEQQTLKIYLIYRLLLSTSLLLIHFASTKPTISLNRGDQIYTEAAVGYALFCWVHFFIARHISPGHNTQAAFIVLVDILFISLMEYSNNTDSVSLSILLMVTVAAGSIMTVGRLALFFAAVASIAVLYKSIFFALAEHTFKSQDFMQNGLLGITFFVTSYLAQRLSSLLRESEAVVKKHVEDLANLEKLNHHIIQRMRTGIMVVNNDNTVVMINDACWKLFHMTAPKANAKLQSISSVIDEQLTKWRSNPLYRGTPFKSSSRGPDVHAHFTPLKMDNNDAVLIFVDDNTRMAQQAQQLKLASLGGLTANIAHEIRNPLGAMSHAAELLSESPDLGKEDVRLTEIIQQHGKRMNKIIENILQLSRKKQTQPELINLEDWLPQFIEEFTATLPNEANIHVNIKNGPVEFRADTSQIHQILSNLLINGLRYNKQQTGNNEVWLSAGIVLSAEQPYIDVTDKGPGIPEDQINKIFEPFFTTDNAGTGLGLYISKELCEANQARLDYIPFEQGSCFRITFTHPGRQVAI